MAVKDKFRKTEVLELQIQNGSLYLESKLIFIIKYQQQLLFSPVQKLFSTQL